MEVCHICRWIGTGLDSLGIIVVLVTVILAVTYKDTISPGIAGLSITYALQVYYLSLLCTCIL